MTAYGGAASDEKRSALLDGKLDRIPAREQGLIVLGPDWQPGVRCRRAGSEAGKA